MSADETIKVEIGMQAVHIEKLFGPTSFADLLVKQEWGDDGVWWAIYRQNGGPHGDVKWELMARIPGQMDSDYDCGCDECAEERGLRE